MHWSPLSSYSHEDNLAIRRATLYNQPGRPLHTLSEVGEESPQNIPTERTDSPPASTPTKWTIAEDASIVKLRRDGRKWRDAAEELPGRSATSCRLRYQNYLERRPQWDEKKQDKLALLYDRLKKDMWSGIAAELGLPYRAVEAMHWQMGAEEMARRANRTVFNTSS
ncbi:hypothetical protein LTR91_019519 [Friedmanniomyces endolithicus]|uniref:Myb-like domain-containing protein n=1 Tax=Friedmanniomyces endolithicus TaxID=329885 RepID=A0AAN6HAJ8_9PEZI|nr:hypothetical protein LTR03_017614 [Friedmanniomyces endolithicus]KAK0962305.1 hypothetical protein LTR91_019519 [Friedmanniomyces endolithicus]KAK1089422.1 hypothetical protein LTR33_000056 [Friedmanniomyces endolithicus]